RVLFRSRDIRVADLFLFSSERYCYMPQMHPDQCLADIDAFLHLYLFNNDRMPEMLISVFTQAAACLTVRDYIDRPAAIRPCCVIFHRNGSVDMLASLEHQIDIVLLSSF